MRQAHLLTNYDTPCLARTHAQARRVRASDTCADSQAILRQQPLDSRIVANQSTKGNAFAAFVGELNLWNRAAAAI